MSAAFVAGATGYTGRAVVRALRARGMETFAHVRPDSPKVAEWNGIFGGEGARVDTTPWTEPAMTETFARLRPSVVFALLGTTRARARKEDASYETVDYGLTALLIRAAVASGTTPRFVYLSSIGVGPKSTNAYLAVRWRAEELLRASGLPWVIARPSFITGPDREESRPAERVGAVLTDGALALVGLLGGRKVKARYASTTADRLAAALVRHALDPAAVALLAEGAALR